MKTIAKYSLNPLARCFVPLSMKAFSKTNDIVSVINNENKATHEVFTAVKGKANTVSQFFGATKESKLQADVEVIGTAESLVTTECFRPTKHKLTNKSTVEMTPKAINGDEISDEPEERTCIQDMSLTELDILLSKGRLCRKNSKILGTGLRLKLLFPAPRVLEVDWFHETVKKNAIMLYITMMLYSVFYLAPQSRCKKLTYSNNIEEVEEEVEDEFKDEECRCPPMFGWIIPHSFFGNPLKLSSTCGKKCAHISYKHESRNLHEEPIQTTLLENESQLRDGTTTLDQCSSQLEAIIKDVCDSVDHTLAMTDNENSKSKNQTKVQLNRPVWESAPQKDLDLEIIDDDGIHPLLKEVNSEDADSKKLLETQELLTKALSHDAETSDPQSVCVLPCTVWCSNVPPPAKDTYRRFIKKFHSESIYKKGADNGKAFRKTLFKRCFSADDASTHCDSNKRPLLSPSSFETRERLLLLHKDPVAFIKRSSRIASGEMKLRSDVSEKLSSGCSDESPYYGADSLWQPLPDCVPVSDHIQKHSHRRMRDMRRQKSVP